MSKQEDLINFIQDPKTISKAVEGSMDKRNALLAVPRKTLKQLPDPTKEDKPTTLKDVLKAIYYMGKDGEGLSDYKLNQAKQEILDLLDSKVIGKDEVFIDIPIVDATGKEIDRINNESFTPYMIARNHLRQTQRQALKELGDK